MMFDFCENCYLRSYLSLKLYILYVILEKRRFKYFLSIACYNETKYIINWVSMIPIENLSNICLNISALSRDTRLYSRAKCRTVSFQKF